MVTKWNETAFPYLDGDSGELSMIEYGLIKRELFAAMALQGLLANPSIDGTHQDIANDAVDYADALLKALNQKPWQVGKSHE